MAITASAITPYIKYDGNEIDHVTKAFIEANLFNENLLVPGVTYNNMFENESAGSFMFRRLDSITVDTTDLKVDGTAGASTPIVVAKDEVYTFNIELPTATLKNMSADIKNQYLAEGMSKISEEWQDAVIAKLIAGVEGTDYLGSINTAKPISTTIYSDVVRDKAVMKKANVKPTTLWVNPDTEATLFQSDEFIKATEMAASEQREGVIGKIAGLFVKVSNAVTANYHMVDYKYLYLAPQLIGAGTTFTEGPNANGHFVGYIAAQIVSGTKLSRKEGMLINEETA